MLWISLVFAGVPLDAEGRWQHVITLEPSVLVWPHAPDRVHETDGFGRDPRGGLVLVGEGDIVHLSADGKLDRDAWKTPRQFAHVSGPVVVDDDGLWGCDRLDGILHFARSGEVEPLGKPVEIGHSCGLYRAQDGSYFGWDSLTATISIFGDAGELKQEAQLPSFVDNDWPKPLSAGPCGSLADGTTLTMASNEPFDRLDLVALDENLMKQDTLLSLNTRKGSALRQPLGVAKAWRPQSCSVDGDLSTLATWNQGIVLDNKGTVQSWFRNGTPLTATKAPASGVGPYAFDGLDFFGTLQERTLVAIVARKGRIQLYRPAIEGEVSPKRARDLSRAGDHLGAEQVWTRWLGEHPDDAEAMLERLQNRTAAGWWGEVIREGKAFDRDDPRFLQAVQARALSLSRWTRRRIRGGGPLFAKEPPKPRERARDGLNELSAFADSSDPIVQEARVRLAIAGRRPYTAELALQKLEALGQTAPLDAAFWTYIRRGDRQTAEGLIGDRERYPDEAAALLRLQGDLEEALQAVEKPEYDSDRIVRAQLLTDLGRLDEALQAWTEVTESMPDHPMLHAGLGLTYLRRGLPELAVQSFLKSLELEENPAVRSNLASAFAALDDRTRMAEALSSLDPDELLVKHQLTAPHRIGSKRGHLAVLAFDVAGGTSTRVGMGDLLATLTVTELVQRGERVVERARIDSVLGELDLQSSAYIDAESAVKAGKLSGAKTLILGNVAEFADRVSLDLRKVDVKTGRVLSASHVDALMELDALKKAVKKGLSDL